MNNDIASGSPFIKKTPGISAAAERQSAASTELPHSHHPRSHDDADFASLMTRRPEEAEADSHVPANFIEGAKQVKNGTKAEQEEGTTLLLPSNEPEIQGAIPSTSSTAIQTLSKGALESAETADTSKKNDTSEQLFTLIVPQETTLLDHQSRTTYLHQGLPSELGKTGSVGGPQTDQNPEEVSAADSARNALQSIATTASNLGKSSEPLTSAPSPQTSTDSSPLKTVMTGQASRVLLKNEINEVPSSVSLTKMFALNGSASREQMYADKAAVVKDASMATAASNVDLHTTPSEDAQPRRTSPGTQELTAPTDKQASLAAVPHQTHPNVTLAAHTLFSGPLTQSSLSANSGKSLLLPTEMHEALSWDPARLASTANATALPTRADIAPHVARQLVEVMAQAAHRPVEIALSPQELGRVRMSVHAEDGAIIVNIVAERADTLDLMRRHIDQLGQTFRAMGYESISFAFGHGDDTGPQTDGSDGSQANGASNNGGAADTPTDQNEPALIQLDRVPTTGVDIRL